MSTAPRRPFFRRRKSCPFSGPNAPKIDYKDTRLLSRYISERGKIVPSRITAVSADQAARTRAGDQARTFPWPAALRHPLMYSRGAFAPLGIPKTPSAPVRCGGELDGAARRPCPNRSETAGQRKADVESNRHRTGSRARLRSPVRGHRPRDGDRDGDALRRSPSNHDRDSGLGLDAGAMAAVVASAVVAGLLDSSSGVSLDLNPSFSLDSSSALSFVLIVALPAWALAAFAGVKDVRIFRRSEPPMVSTRASAGALAVAAACAGIIVGLGEVITMILAYGGYEKGVAATAQMLRPGIEDALGGVVGLPEDITVDQATFLAVKFGPPFVAALIALVMMANLYAAARSAQMSQRLSRPWLDLPTSLNCLCRSWRSQSSHWRSGWARRSPPTSSPPFLSADSASPTSYRGSRCCMRFPVERPAALP